MHIYTDGSCSQGKAEYTTQAGGWAVVVMQDNEFVIKVLAGGQKGTTNNAMEMTAFVAALNIIGEEVLAREDYGEFNIYSDSAYIINGLKQKWYINWRRNGWKNAKKDPVKNKELWVEVINLWEYFERTGVIVNAIKVKGHSNNIGNNLVDEYAVKERKKYE